MFIFWHGRFISSLTVVSLAIILSIVGYISSGKAVERPEGYKNVRGFEEFYPVAVKCPVRRSGKYEIISKHANGNSYRLAISYRGTPNKVTFDVRPKNADRWTLVFEVEMKHPESEKHKEVGKKIIEEQDMFFAKACDGSIQQREKLFSIIETNARELRGR
jgi:hypothetical protein